MGVFALFDGYGCFIYVRILHENSLPLTVLLLLSGAVITVGDNNFFAL